MNPYEVGGRRLRRRGRLPHGARERLVLAPRPRQRRPVRGRLLAGPAVRGHGAAGRLRRALRSTAGTSGSTAGADRGALAVSRTPRRGARRPGAPAASAGAGLLGLALARHTDASLPVLGFVDHVLQPGRPVHADAEVARELARLDRGGRRLRGDVRLQVALPDWRGSTRSSSSWPSWDFASGTSPRARAAGAPAPLG